jgi:hypothetical protein
MDDFIEVLDIKYEMALMITKEINISEYWYILKYIFDEEPQRGSTLERGVQMRYTRVENYIKMDEISSHITDLFKQSVNESEILASLKTAFQMTEEEAILRIVQFFNDFTIIQGKNVVENSGFPIEFYIDAFENKLHVKISNIVNIHYLTSIFTYLDSFIRITQDPASTDVKWSRIRKLKEKKITEKQIEKEEKKEVFENVITNERENIRLKPVEFGRRVFEEEEYDEDIEEQDRNKYEENEDEEDLFFGYANEDENEEDVDKDEDNVKDTRNRKFKDDDKSM